MAVSSIVVTLGSGNSTPLTGSQLSGLFSLISHKTHLECVVLNCCYSVSQVQAIANHVPYVVGMREAVGDEAAIEFAVGFYDAIWNGDSVEFAFQSGKVAAQFASSKASGEPVLFPGKINSVSKHGEESEKRDTKSEGAQAQKTIVLLSAYVLEEDQSFRKREVSKIDEAISRAAIAVIEKAKSLPIYRQPLDRSEIETSEISKLLSATEPSIINISGPINGLHTLLLDSVEAVDADDLIGDFFKFTSKKTNCVVLNGCYIKEQAIRIVKHIEFLVGIGSDLSHDTAFIFLNEFYYQIGINRGLVQQAYNIACNRIGRIGVEKSNLPVLLSRKQEEKRKLLEEKLLKVDKKIEKSPQDAGLRVNKGDLLEEAGSHERAASAYDRSLYIDEKDYKVWWKLGKALFNAEKYSEARQPYQRALALCSEPQDEYIIARERGSLLCLLHEYGSSAGLYKKALWLNPRYRAANYERKKAYRMMYANRKQ